jgi:hypothetical protein
MKLSSNIEVSALAGTRETKEKCILLVLDL